MITEFPDYKQLPKECLSSFVEGEKRLKEAKAGDFSITVVAFSKAIEVALRQMVYDKYGNKYQYEIIANREININIIGNKHTAESLLRFVERGYFIALGEMANLICLCNQQYAIKAPCIRDLRKFIFTELKFIKLLDPKIINILVDLPKKYRNDAVHSKVLDRSAALDVREVAIEILSCFRAVSD